MIAVIVALAAATSVGAAVAIERAHRPRGGDWWRPELLSEVYRKQRTTGDKP